MDFTALDCAAKELGCKVIAKEPMSAHTTFRIGGAADRFVTVENTHQLAALQKLAAEENLPTFVLGRGSNLLVSDKGIRGVVLQLSGEFRQITLLEDRKTLRAGAGVSLMTLCKFAADHALSGLEFAYGIPGAVGGAVYMDAGAYGGEMKDVVCSVTHMTPTGELVTVPAEELDFSYRHSRYSGGNDVILFAEFALNPQPQAEIFSKMQELLARRKEKQPYDLPSAGSIFKRPQNGFAAAMIEECGLKGRSVGGAQVSPKHAGFIVNIGGAACSDVLALIAEIQKEVLQQTGTLLECEVRVTGEE